MSENENLSELTPTFDPDESGKVKKTEKRTKGNKVVMVILFGAVILLSAALGTSIYFWQKEKNKITNPLEAANAEVEKVKKLVGKHIMLPTDVNPSVATIINADEMKKDNAEFYKNANDGDKLLVYSDRAILYSVDKDIIVNVAPIFKQPEAPDSQNNLLKIELRDGTGKGASVYSPIETKIAALGEKYSVLAKSDAANKNYTGSKIYNLAGESKSELVNSLAQELGLTVETTLPAGEAASNADVVVIIGK